MPSDPDRPVLAISAPILARRPDGGWRVSATVGREEVFLEADEPLAAGADAFVAAFLLPAARAGATLRVDAELDRALSANLDAIQAIARRDWGFPGARVETSGTADRAPAGAGAMFFTGGMDSFYTLRRHRDSIARLVHVDGFDLSVAGTPRAALVRANVAAIARECGLGVEFPRTNLRRDPTFRRLGWERGFGAALAAVAHLVAPRVARMWIASSTMVTNYGSTAELDPLWGSGAVSFVHDGVEASRPEKAAAIADWPLVHRFLRVCFAPGIDGLNCGRCQKCVRAQASFAAVGALDRLRTFPRADLAGLIDGVEFVDPVNRNSWRTIRDATDDRAVVAAIDRMVARRPRPGTRLRDALRPWFDPWLDRVPGGRAARALGRRLLGG